MTVDWSSTSEPFLVGIIEKISDVEKAMRNRLDALEVRLDLLRDEPEEKIESLLCKLKEEKISILLTARLEKDGGKWPSSEEKRRREWLVRFSGHADIVDVEADLRPKARSALVHDLRRATPQKKIVLSYHNMEKVPSNRRLDALYAESGHSGADRLKLACYAPTAEEADRLAQWAIHCANGKTPLTIIAMGEEGCWTRWVLPLLLGGPAYAPLGRAVAPGQLKLEHLRKLSVIE